MAVNFGCFLCEIGEKVTFFQDKFDHDKGQKSAISGRRLHWRLSTGFFALSPGFVCNLVRRAPENLEKVAKNPVEKIAQNPVTSVAVMVFFGPDFWREIAHQLRCAPQKFKRDLWDLLP